MGTIRKRAIPKAAVLSALLVLAASACGGRDAGGGAGTGAGYSVPVVYDSLDNGLRVVLSEDHTAPTATVAVYYEVGFRVEPQGRTGFAHLSSTSARSSRTKYA